ncbi:MAG: hypothetical protein K0Q67_2229, partial [Cellvibrio sp.]|nr:hypothetical protein [Cellvibrio sp.]
MESVERDLLQMDFYLFDLLNYFPR